MKLNWLGRPLIEFRRRPVKLETHKTTALLAYLSLSPPGCHREFLATMFWPEGNQQKALANLRQALSSLKNSLPGWTHANRETIQLKEDVKLWVDVNTFHRLLSQYKEHHPHDNAACDDCLSVLESAAALYQGDFLTDLNLPNSPGFDEWQLSLRESLRQEFANALQIIALGNAVVISATEM